MSRTKNKIVSMLLLITIIMTQLSVFAVSEEVVHDQNRISWYTTEDGIGAAMYKVKVADKYAYCVDYQYQIPVNGTVSDLNENLKLSTETLSVLKYGFPNVSYKELGLKTEEEAYVATQLAVWQVVSLKDNRHATNGFALTKLTVKDANKEEATRALNAAKVLAEKALKNPVKPSININASKATQVIKNGEFVAGPYTLNVVDTEVNSYKIAVSNSAAYVADKDGKKVENNTVSQNSEFYIRWPETLNGSTMRITASAVANISKAVICVVNEKGLQSFGVEVTDEVTLNASTNVSWATSTGKIIVTKVDQDLNKVVGAKFALKDATGKVVATKVIDSTGTLVFDSVKVGDYTVLETEAPAGYIKTDKVESVKVVKDSVTKLTFTNTKIYGNMQITKKDDAGKLLSNVKFEIKNAAGKVVETIVTNENGVATTTKLPYGTYKYKEISAPAGYVLNTNEVAFNIKENNKTVQITVVNQRVKGQLKIVKTEDLENKPLANVKFEIRDSKGNVVEVITTNACGIAMTSKLLIGKYSYKEISAPEGIIVDTKSYDFEITKNNEVIVKNIVNVRVKGGLKITKVDDENKPLANVKFEVKDQSGKVVEVITTDANGIASTKKLPFGKYTYKEVSAPANVEMNTATNTFEVVSNEKIVEKTVVNKIIKGKLEITKKDDAGKSLSNVKFEIKDASGKVVEVITTNMRGVATTKELPYGKYTYKEISAPSNVVMNQEVKSFQITKQNQVVKATVVNNRVKGSLVITKVDDENKPIANVEFEIRNSFKMLVTTVKTNEQGVAEVSDLLKGKYTYKEISAPTGYVLEDSEYDFEIETNNQKVEAKVINQRIFGSLRIEKIDDVNKAPLANVTFEIKNEAGEVVDTIVTDEKGIAQSKLLFAGKYTYQETEVPDDIVIDDQEYTFEIVEHEKVIVKEITNTKIKGNLRIRKVEKGTQNPIANVKFEIYDENKNIIETVVTDEKGMAISTSLVKGKYYFVEVEAPDKYELDSSKHNFEITTHKEILDAMVENALRRLPQTGGLGTDTLIIMVVSLLSVGGYLFMSKKNS